MSLRSREVFPPRERVKHRSSGAEGEVQAIAAGARRRVVWDDGRTTLTHIADLLETADHHA